MDIHVNANVKLLDVRRKRQIILCIWRNIQTGFIETYVPARVTRTGMCKLVRLPIPRTELYKKSVNYVGCKMWNDLNDELRNIDNLQEFKKEMYVLY